MDLKTYSQKGSRELCGTSKKMIINLLCQNCILVLTAPVFKPRFGCLNFSPSSTWQSQFVPGSKISSQRPFLTPDRSQSRQCWPYCGVTLWPCIKKYFSFLPFTSAITQMFHFLLLYTINIRISVWTKSKQSHDVTCQSMKNKTLHWKSQLLSCKLHD